MYKVIITNYVNKTQKEFCQIAYLDRATEVCEIEALKFVVGKEGEKYLRKPLRVKGYLPAGYSVVKSGNDFIGKYTVYHKEKNGYLLSGAVKKIMVFETIRCEPTEWFLRESQMTIENQESLMNVLSYLEENPLMNLKSIKDEVMEDK